MGRLLGLLMDYWPWDSRLDSLCLETEMVYSGDSKSAIQADHLDRNKNHPHGNILQPAYIKDF